MPRSLVARLTLLVTAVIALAFAVLATILFRSTSVAYVRTTEVVQQGPPAAQLRQLEPAARLAALEHGRAGLERLAVDPASFGLPADIAFLVVGPDLALLASTEPVLAAARIRREGPDALSITVGGDGAAERAELQLTTHTGTELRDRSGELLGRLVLLPGPLDANPGDAFALGIWRSAARWLLAVIGVSVLLTALVLRWFLRPIDQLTAAAHTLVEGRHPAPMAPSGHEEIDRLIAAFNAAAAAITQTEGMRRQLISDIAHELRTPLTNLKAQVEAAAQGLIDIDDELLATLGGEVELLAALVEDFQQLALSDAGQLRLSPEPLPLKATLDAIVAPMALHAGASCRIQVDPELVVLADPQRLRQVFGNLVENARRARREGLVLSIDAQPCAGHVRIRFADNGPGIAPGDRPHVFERFYRADKSRNRASGGAGLGLSIARALIEAMHGRIRLLPADDSGAVFEIELQRSG